VVEKVREFGCDLSSAPSLLDEANSTFNTGNYEEAIKYAKQSEKTTKKIQEESEPEITLKLPEETFPAPHSVQNLVPTGTSAPHSEQITTFRTSCTGGAVTGAGETPPPTTTGCPLPLPVTTVVPLDAAPCALVAAVVPICLSASAAIRSIRSPPLSAIS